MKTLVTRACGHTETVEVFGSTAERESKINWYKNTVCSECHAKEQNSDCEEITMSYSQYKNEYSDCKTKPNSYNKSAKTIIVYVKKAPVETIEAVEETPAETVEAITTEQIAKDLECTEDQLKSLLSLSAEKYQEKLVAVKNQIIEINNTEIYVGRETKIKKLQKMQSTIEMIIAYKSQQ